MSESNDAVTWPAWSDAEHNLREAWARGYPNEKMLTLEPNGQPDAFEKETPTGETVIDEYGDHHVVLVKRKFARVPAKALVQLGAGQKIYSLGAVFMREGDVFSFQDISVGGSTDVVQAGELVPSKELAKQLIAALFESLNPGSKVQEVKCADLERKSQASKGRWWYSTGADIYVVKPGGGTTRYSNDMTSIFKGEKGKEGVDASGDWKASFIDKPQAK